MCRRAFGQTLNLVGRRAAFRVQQINSLYSQKCGGRCATRCPLLALSLSMVSAVLEKSLRTSTVSRCSSRDSWTNSCWLSTSSCTDWARTSRDRDTDVSSIRLARCCSRLWAASWATWSWEPREDAPAGSGSAGEEVEGGRGGEEAGGGAGGGGMEEEEGSEVASGAGGGGTKLGGDGAGGAEDEAASEGGGGGGEGPGGGLEEELWLGDGFWFWLLFLE